MRNNIGFSKSLKIALVIGLLIILPSFGQDAVLRQPSAEAEQGDSLKASLEIAHAQHEIILLYIKNDQLDKVGPAVQILLSLRFPPEQELSTVKSLLIITEKLYEKGESGLAHQILSAATKAVNDNANKAKVYLIQARAYKRDGLDDKAIECYKKSQELSTKIPE